MDLAYIFVAWNFMKLPKSVISAPVHLICFSVANHVWNISGLFHRLFYLPSPPGCGRAHNGCTIVHDALGSVPAKGRCLCGIYACTIRPSFLAHDGIPMGGLGYILGVAPSQQQCQMKIYRDPLVEME